MSQTLEPGLCAKCHHPESNHGVVCSGELMCMCEKFIKPVLVAFAQEIEMQKAKLRSVYERCRYILEKIPPTRNAGEKTFAKIYREIWYGFKIRKEGTKITTEEFNRMKHDDTINRQKRLVKADSSSLATYDPEMQYHQSALYIAICELAIDK